MARRLIGLSTADVARMLGEVGYKEGGVKGKTVWYWENGSLNVVTTDMIQAAAKITKQSEPILSAKLR